MASGDQDKFTVNMDCVPWSDPKMTQPAVSGTIDGTNAPLVLKSGMQLDLAETLVHAYGLRLSSGQIVYLRKSQASPEGGATASAVSAGAPVSQVGAGQGADIASKSSARYQNAPKRHDGAQFVAALLQIIGGLSLVFGVAGSVLLGIEAANACENSLRDCDPTNDGLTIGVAFGASSVISGLVLIGLGYGISLLCEIAEKD